MIAWRLKAVDGSVEPVDIELDALNDRVVNSVLNDIMDMLHDINILTNGVGKHVITGEEIQAGYGEVR